MLWRTGRKTISEVNIHSICITNVECERRTSILDDISDGEDTITDTAISELRNGNVHIYVHKRLRLA
jgi:hypothetical protein